MKIKLKIVVSVALILISQNILAQITPSQIDSLMEKSMKEFKVVGASIAVIKDRKLFYEKGYGKKSIKTNEAVNAQTNFQIASNSKAFTTAALSILVDESKISWKDKVKKYIPEFKKLNDAVHEAGGKTCIQLWQGGLAVASDQTAQILVPDDLPLSPQYTVPAITNERLLDIIDKFGQAAKRAVEAGFDCLEFHCAHLTMSG